MAIFGQFDSGHYAYGGLTESEVDILGERELLCNDDKFEDQFTRWTMKSDHGRWPFSMVQLL